MILHRMSRAAKAALILLACGLGLGTAPALDYEPVFSLESATGERFNSQRISEDATRFLWTREVPMDFELYSRDLELGETTEISNETPLPETDRDTSADGRYQALRISGMFPIQVVIRDNQLGTDQVVARTPFSTQPVISADGAVAAFVVADEDGSGGGEVLVVDRVSGATTRIDPLPGGTPFIQELSISADGSAIGVLAALEEDDRWLVAAFRAVATGPEARCQDLVVATDPGECFATVAAQAFDAGSSDPQGLPLAFSVMPAGPYPVGTTAVTLVVTTSAGSATCPAQVTVEDREAPRVACRVARPLLPFATGTLVDVGLRIVASDNCAVAGIAVAVTQDEPVHGEGDPCDPDAELIEDGAGGIDGLRLRAQADRRGDGRVYFVEVTATDGHGNAASDHCVVVVPRSLRLGDLLAAFIGGFLADLFGESLPFDSFACESPVGAS